MKGRTGKIKCEKALSKKEASPAQGDRDRALAEAQFKFGVERDPAAAFTKSFNAAALQTPGGIPAGPGQGGFSRLSSAGAPLPTTGTPLSTQQAFRGNTNLAPSIRNIAGSEGDFQLPNYGNLSTLLPSQREQVGAGLRTMGYEPEDVFEQSRRMTTTSLPSRAQYTYGRRKAGTGLI